MGHDAQREITWGNTVRIRDNAPEGVRRGYAEVCGFGVVETVEHSSSTGWPLGTLWVTIEYGDGVSIQAPVAWVELVDDDPPAARE